MITSTLIFFKLLWNKFYKRKMRGEKLIDQVTRPFFTQAQVCRLRIYIVSVTGYFRTNWHARATAGQIIREVFCSIFLFQFEIAFVSCRRTKVIQKEAWPKVFISEYAYCMGSFSVECKCWRTPPLVKKVTKIIVRPFAALWTFTSWATAAIQQKMQLLKQCLDNVNRFLG